VEASEVTRRIVAASEAGDLLTSCAWCERVRFDGGWVRVPPAALIAIDAHRSLSHSLCPECAAAFERPTP
jgi:uncharacterized protein YbbK (DUF523 family)